METAGIKKQYAALCAAYVVFWRKVAEVEHERKAIRLGLTVIACALAARLMGIAAEPVAQFLAQPEVASFLVYMETGRVVRVPVEPPETMASETTAPTEPTQPPVGEVTFQPEDAELIEISNLCDYPVDAEAMLMTELTWDLTGEGPTVLILHSHATESYTKTEQYSYEASSAYRTLDTQYNVVRVGAALKEALEAQGIGVIHDTTLHDYPSYTDAYIQSREAVERYLEQYPTITMVIDLHRDAANLSAGGQLDTQAAVEGQQSAQLMLVVGTNAGGRTHPDWQENMALAVKLHAQLEKRFPGICRPISFRTERFNQDLSPGALLIEVGAAGDTLEEALVAARALAAGIADLAGGTATASSTS